jgi:succinate dehydrogenase / fumarate reductase cytochrome b subunit
MNIEQAQPRPLQPGIWQRLAHWFDVRRGALGMIAFVLNRITGIGLVLYLGLHLVVLSLLAGGKVTWDSFLGIMSSPFVLVMDVVLIAGILIHGLNGVRVTLSGFGIGLKQHKTAFLLLMALALLLVVFAGVGIFTIE